MPQSTFNGTEKFDQIDWMKVYFKPINERQFTEESIVRTIDKQNILSIVEDLKQTGKMIMFEDIELNANPNEYVTRLLETESKKCMQFLLNDFTDSMKTRMREDNKFVIAFHFKNCLTLCHSRSDESTITSNWTVVKRMLDKDNVDRFVIFEKRKDGILTWFYEYNKSESFINWLGLPDKEAFFVLGGRNKFYAKIHGIGCSLELNDKEVERMMLEGEGQFDILENTIVFRNPIKSLNINQIRVGKRRYNSILDFLQDSNAKRFGLDSYQEKYTSLVNTIQPILNVCIDEEDKVIQKDSGKDDTLVFKKNQNFVILFGTKKEELTLIDFRHSFLQKIVSHILNQEKVRLFHAGMRLLPSGTQPLIIGSIELWNDLEVSSNLGGLIQNYNDLKLKDVILDRILLCAIFEILKRDNQKHPISFFFKQVSAILCNFIDLKGKFCQSEGDIIEYKSGDMLTGKDAFVVERIYNDLEKKLLTSNKKVYIFGFEESNVIAPLSSGRFPSDRVGNIEKKLAEKFSKNVIINLIKVDTSKGKCLIILCVLANVQGIDVTAQMYTQNIIPSENG